MEFGRAIRYNVNIKPTDNMGFIVKVGCAELVFENKDNLISAFSEFINDPKGTERKYNESGIYNGPPAQVIPPRSGIEQQPEGLEEDKYK